MNKEIDFLEEEMKQFGRFEKLVREWCRKHKQAWIMEEFKELFEMIEQKTKEKVIEDIEEIESHLTQRGNNAQFVLMELKQKLKEEKE